MYCIVAIYEIICAATKCPSLAEFTASFFGGPEKEVDESYCNMGWRMVIEAAFSFALTSFVAVPLFLILALQDEDDCLFLVGFLPFMAMATGTFLSWQWHRVLCFQVRSRGIAYLYSY